MSFQEGAVLIKVVASGTRMSGVYLMQGKKETGVDLFLQGEF
jgi:hypothetical protein